MPACVRMTWTVVAGAAVSADVESSGRRRQSVQKITAGSPGCGRARNNALSWCMKEEGPGKVNRGARHRRRGQVLTLKTARLRCRLPVFPPAASRFSSTIKPGPRRRGMLRYELVYELRKLVFSLMPGTPRYTSSWVSARGPQAG